MPATSRRPLDELRVDENLSVSLSSGKQMRNGSRCHFILLTAFVALGIACGGSNNGTLNPDGGPGTGGPGDSGVASVTGSVGGFTLVPVSSFGVSTSATCRQAYITGAVIGLADFVASCNAIQTQSLKAGSTTLTLSVIRAGLSAQQPISPGTYTVSPNPVVDLTGSVMIVQANFDKLDNACRSKLSGSQGDATSGTIMISSITDNIVGTFELNFSGGGHLSGNFNAPGCTLSSSLLCGSIGVDGGTPSSTCQP